MEPAEDPKEQYGYSLIGIHHGAGNQPREAQPVPGVPDGTSVARVRMFINGEAVDEDIILPQIITVEQQIDEAVHKRITELVRGVKLEDSEVHNPNDVPNQVITEAALPVLEGLK